MIYSWKLPGLFPVDAQTAGEELDRIAREKGQLDAGDVVEESRPESAPLHCCFEWDDKKAAERFRRSQAATIIQHITVLQETVKNEPVTVRAFVNVDRAYLPLHVVLNNEGLREEMMRNALSDMDNFQRKYETLEQLAPVFSAFKSVRDIINPQGNNG